MKSEIKALLAASLQVIADQQNTELEFNAEKIQLTPPKDLKHGDLSTNLALVTAKKLRLAPRSIAETFAEALASHPNVTQVKIEGPGFINLFLARDVACQVIKDILVQGEGYGQTQLGQHQTIHLEYVSANPTGPLHVGHGRGAAYGASLANILKATGFNVHREYYVNDAGRQMNILAISVWFRYLEIQQINVALPPNAYQGEYILDIAQDLVNCNADQLVKSQAEIFQDITDIDHSASETEQKRQAEARLDALIQRAQDLLGSEGYQKVFNAGLNAILQDIQADLEEFGVEYDRWFSEKSLVASDKIQTAIDKLTKLGFTYQEKGNLWFKSTEFGDDKDRVMIRDNGQPTYFASDIAYHLHKLEAGYHKLINIWGADHHGYIARVAAAIEALSGKTESADKLKVLLVQFAILYRKGERVSMSTRSGSFVTLRELRDEVSNDAARFFYVLRKSEQHMDFDLDLAKSQTKDNPVYYIQYAHARISKLLSNAKNDNNERLQQLEKADLNTLVKPIEHKLIKQLNQFIPTLERAAKDFEPHLLAHYLRDLASEFHGFYNDEPILTAIDDSLKYARLAACKATQVVIKQGLFLLGVSAPESM